jgi:hypothetical protein
MDDAHDQLPTAVIENHPEVYTKYIADKFVWRFLSHFQKWLKNSNLKLLSIRRSIR